MACALVNGVFVFPSRQGEDIYGNLVGPTYRADMWTQTWQDGARLDAVPRGDSACDTVLLLLCPGTNPLPNFCTPTHTYNTLNIDSYSVFGACCVVLGDCAVN